MYGPFMIVNPDYLISVREMAKRKFTRMGGARRNITAW